MSARKMKTIYKKNLSDSSDLEYGIAERNRFPKRQIQKIIDALRSGKFKQTVLTLQDAGGFCCLGVGCKTVIPEVKQLKDEQGWLEGVLPEQQPESPYFLSRLDCNFDNLTGIRLVDLNDIYRASFDDIADLLQAVYIEDIYVEGLQK